MSLDSCSTSCSGSSPQTNQCQSCGRNYNVADNQLLCYTAQGNGYYKRGPVKSTGQGGWDETNRKDCCIGNKNDTDSCDPSWCPFSENCQDMMMDYCIASDPNDVTGNADGIKNRPRILTDQRCKDWLTTQSQAVKDQVATQVCATASNPYLVKEPFCQSWCKLSTSDCDDVLRRYTASEYKYNTNAALNTDPMTGCFLPQEVYLKFFNDISSKIGNLPSALTDNPGCYFPQCAISDFKRYSFKAGQTPCPTNVSQCISNATINNDGTINTNSVDVKTAENCFNSATGNKPNPTPTPTPDPSPSPNPTPTPTPVPDPAGGAGSDSELEKDIRSLRIFVKKNKTELVLGSLAFVSLLTLLKK